MVRRDVGGFRLRSQFAWQALHGLQLPMAVHGYALAGVIGYRALRRELRRWIRASTPMA